MIARRIDEEISLVKYYPNDKAALPWYQDSELCRQVDNREEVYDLPRLKRMYRYLNQNGRLFYIKYKNRLCGDVCLKNDGEICIVIAKKYQNRHIGRRVIGDIVALAKEEGMKTVCAEIFAFNRQSQRMFESVGFQKTAEERYTLSLESIG